MTLSTMILIIAITAVISFYYGYRTGTLNVESDVKLWKKEYYELYYDHMKLGRDLGGKFQAKDPDNDVLKRQIAEIDIELFEASKALHELEEEA